MWSFFWIILIAFLYFLPGKDLPASGIWDMLNADKLGHLLVFLFLVVFSITGLRKQSWSGWLAQRSNWVAVGFAIVYGAFLEYFQGKVSPDRHSDVMDFIANSIGAVLGIVIFRLIYGRSL